MAAFFLNGCGVREISEVAPKVTTVSPTSVLIAEEGGCEKDITPESTEFLTKIEEFYTTVTLDIAAMNREQGLGLATPSSVGTGVYLFGTAQKPLRMSLPVLNTSFSNLQREWNKLKEEAEELNDFSRRLNALLIKARRFQALSCQREELQDRAFNDVRTFLIYKQKNQDPLELCKVFKEGPICEMEKLLLKRGGNLNQFKRNYEGPFLRRLENFYSYEPTLKFQCVKVEDQEQRTIIIPIEFDEIFYRKVHSSFGALNTLVANKWSNDNLIIKFVPYEKELHKQRIKIKWSNSHLSYVKKTQRDIIYMSPFLGFNSLLLTLAHELGHSLGFSDCYHEFYDKEEKQIIYYSLDETGKNLMCHLDPLAKIPNDYMKKIEQSLCSDPSL